MYSGVNYRGVSIKTIGCFSPRATFPWLHDCQLCCKVASMPSRNTGTFHVSSSFEIVIAIALSCNSWNFHVGIYLVYVVPPARLGGKAGVVYS